MHGSAARPSTSQTTLSSTFRDRCVFLTQLAVSVRTCVKDTTISAKGFRAQAATTTRRFVYLLSLRSLSCHGSPIYMRCPSALYPSCSPRLSCVLASSHHGAFCLEETPSTHFSRQESQMVQRRIPCRAQSTPQAPRAQSCGRAVAGQDAARRGRAFFFTIAVRSPTLHCVRTARDVGSCVCG